MGLKNFNKSHEIWDFKLHKVFPMQKKLGEFKWIGIGETILDKIQSNYYR